MRYQRAVPRCSLSTKRTSARPEAVGEVEGQLRGVLLQPGGRVAERASHGHPGPLGVAAHGPQPTTEPDGAAQLGDEVVAVALGQLGPCRIVAPERIVDVLVDLGQPPPVGLAGLVVQHRQTGTRGCEVVDGIDRGRRRRRQRPLLDATRSSTWNSRPGSASIIKNMAIMAAARAAPGRSPAVHSRPCWASHAAIDASKSPFP